MSIKYRNLLRQHENYVISAKKHGAKTAVFLTPCCETAIEVTIPKVAGEQWDSFMTCPYCGGLFLKIANHEGAHGVLPPKDL